MRTRELLFPGIVRCDEDTEFYIYWDTGGPVTVDGTKFNAVTFTIDSTGSSTDGNVRITKADKPPTNKNRRFYDVCVCLAY